MRDSFHLVIPSEKNFSKDLRKPTTTTSYHSIIVLHRSFTFFRTFNIAAICINRSNVYSSSPLLFWTATSRMFANRSTLCLSYRLVDRYSGRLIAQSEASWRQPPLPAIPYYYLIAARSFAKKGKKKWKPKRAKKPPKSVLLEEIEARFAPAEQEPFSERRGHDYMREYLKQQGMDFTNVEGYLRRSLYTRFALRNKCRKIENFSRKKMAVSFLGHPTIQRIEQQHGKQIIMEQWYYGNSPLLDLYKQRHEEWVEQQRKLEEATEDDDDGKPNPKLGYLPKKPIEYQCTLVDHKHKSAIKNVGNDHDDTQDANGDNDKEEEEEEDDDDKEEEDDNVDDDDDSDPKEQSKEEDDDGEELKK